MTAGAATEASDQLGVERLQHGGLVGLGQRSCLDGGIQPSHQVGPVFSTTLLTIGLGLLVYDRQRGLDLGFGDSEVLRQGLGECGLMLRALLRSRGSGLALVGGLGVGAKLVPYARIPPGIGP